MKITKSVRSSKYGAKKVTAADGTFDSQLEYKRWCELKVLQRIGEIANLERQVAFELVVNNVRIGKFTADHRWVEPATGKTVVEDVKGMMVRDVGLRLKLMKAVHGIDVQIWPKKTRKKRNRKQTTQS